MHPTQTLIHPINCPVHRQLGDYDGQRRPGFAFDRFSYRAAFTFKCRRLSTLGERTVGRLTRGPKVPQAQTTKLFCPQSVAAVLVGDASLADGMHCIFLVLKRPNARRTASRFIAETSANEQIMASAIVTIQHGCGCVFRNSGKVSAEW